MARQLQWINVLVVNPEDLMWSSQSIYVLWCWKSEADTEMLQGKNFAGQTIISIPYQRQGCFLFVSEQIRKVNFAIIFMIMGKVYVVGL